MSKLLPIIGGITGTVAIGGGGAYLISTQRAPTFREKFKDALIKLDDNEDKDKLLKTKLEKLKEGTLNSDNKNLKEAQDKAKAKPATDNNAGLAELKKACKEIYDSSFNKKDSPIFKDFQSYCAITNKDKFETSKWNSENAGETWKAKHEGLKAKKQTLVTKLAEIAEKTSTDGKELKAWCDSNGELVFEGDNDQIYKNINEFCTKP